MATIIKKKVFFIYIDDFLIYRLCEFDSIPQADEYLEEILEDNPKNRVVFKNYSSIDQKMLDFA